MESGNTMIAVLTLGVASITVIVMILIPLCGFAYRTLNSRITDVKNDSEKGVAAEERRRKDDIAGVVLVVNSNYTALRADLQFIRDDIKGLRNVE
jgi:hypothetical protein